MAKFLLKRIVTTSSVWEADAETVSDALKATENGTAKQIGWDQTETVVKVVSESPDMERDLIEGRRKADKI